MREVTERDKKCQYVTHAEMLEVLKLFVVPLQKYSTHSEMAMIPVVQKNLK
jgi:hypothetical protein